MRSPGRSHPARPDVSVIVPVWNVEPYLAECLDSVVGQTIGLDRIELIAVDDGSTDGSGRMLDEYAARHPQIRVFHEPNSGGPGRPRNVGLDHAGGRYVFFLDADDYLGAEALERLVGMAERNESDVVLGKVVGIGGRPVPIKAFRRTADRVDLELVYQTGGVLKLFRRSLIERVGIRFREGIAGGEDGAFTAQAYFEARTISVVADYDCYFARRREGSQTRRKDRHDDLVEKVARLEADRMALVARYRKPGLGRDVLMVKHIKECIKICQQRWLALEPDERRRVFEAASAVMQRWHTWRIQRGLQPWLAVRAYCLQHGLLAELEDIVASPAGLEFRDPIVEGRRIFARYPHFRDASGIPDSCFDITRYVTLQQETTRAAVVDGRLELSGEAYLTLVGGAPTIELRRWPFGARWRYPMTARPTPALRDWKVSHPNSGFDVVVDLASAAAGRPLAAGTWEVYLSLDTGSIRRTLPLRAPLGPGRGSGADGSMDAAGSAALQVTATGGLRVRIGHPGRLVTSLERLERVYVRLSRFVLRPLTSSRAGRLLGRALRERRPETGSLVD